MAYLLDTNIVIHAGEGKATVLNKFAQHAGSLLISALSLVELQRGLYKHPSLTTRRQYQLRMLLNHIPVVPFDHAAAEAYGQIIAACGWSRLRDFDRMIAGHAISTASILVTDNLVDFRRIPGLSVENWVRS